MRLGPHGGFIVTPGGRHGLPILWPLLPIDREWALGRGVKHPISNFAFSLGEHGAHAPGHGCSLEGGARGFLNVGGLNACFVFGEGRGSHSIQRYTGDPPHCGLRIVVPAADTPFFAILASTRPGTAPPVNALFQTARATFYLPWSH